MTKSNSHRAAAATEDHDADNHGDAESSGYESEILVTESLSLGHRLDVALHHVRVYFAFALALPISWSFLHPSIQSFKNNQFRLVTEGTKTVQWIQKHRHPILDIYFQIFSFFAEQEFYLVLLPVLFWNIDYLLGHRFALIVMNGLFIGNIIKDVFELPRPSTDAVWRPGHQASIDSASLADYGFPSTHAMNGVTNSLIILWHFQEKYPDLFSSPFALLMGYTVAGLYIFSLSMSRVYLGAHTPTDLRGGLVLGFLIILGYWSQRQLIDSILLNTPYLPIKGLLGCIIALLLCPQPRPVTPTFEINSLLAGCILGEMIGVQAAYRYGLESMNTKAIDDLNMLQVFSPSYENAVIPWLSIESSALLQVQRFTSKLPFMLPYGVFLFFRTVFGIILLAITRVVMKSVTASLLGVLQIRVKPLPESESIVPEGATPKRKERRTPRSKSPMNTRQVVRLFMRDIDIVGVAIQKTLTYTALAFMITFGAPLVFVILGW